MQILRMKPTKKDMLALMDNKGLKNLFDDVIDDYVYVQQQLDMVQKTINEIKKEIKKRDKLTKNTIYMYARMK